MSGEFKTNALSMRVQLKGVILIVLLPGLFLVDVFYGLADYLRFSVAVTPGVLVRGMLLAFALFFIFASRSGEGKVEFRYLVLLFVFAFPGLLNGLIYGRGLGYDFSQLAKVLYLPVLSVFFIMCFSRLKVSCDDVIRAIEIAAYFLGLSLLLSQVFGVTRDTYGDYAFGTTGIFYAQNDLTLAFGLALLAASYRLVFVRFSFVRLFFLVASFFACLQIGTMASLAIPVIVVCVLFSVYILGGVRGTLLDYFVRFMAFGVASCVLLYMFSQALETFFTYDYQARKVEALLGGESARGPLISAAESYISRRDYLFDFFGEGFDSFHRGVATYFSSSDGRRFVESDPYDIFGAHGVLFLCAIYFYLFRFFFWSIFRVVTRKVSGVYVLIASAIFLYVFYSVLVGHALTSPIPSTLLAAYLAVFHVAERERNI